MISPSRRFCLLLLALLLLAAAAGSWWWFRSDRIDPPMPPIIQDAEVRQVISNARQQVLDRPRSADAWGYLGKVLLAHLFDREAGICFTQASRLDPNDPHWPYALGLIALKRDPDNAAPLLRQAVEASDSWPEQQGAMRLQLAEALLEHGKLDEAEELFRDEHRRQPENPRAAFGLGLIAVGRGKEADAERFLLIARTSRYARKRATAQLAAIARSRGDESTAQTYDRETAQLPDDRAWPDPLLDELQQLQVGRRGRQRRIAQLEEQHRYEEAAAIYLKQNEEEPTAEACVGAGVNLARLRDYDRALPLLRQAVKLDPESAQAHYTLALVQFTKAEKAWKASPGSAEAKEWLREVVKHARKATQIKPAHAQAYLFWGLALSYLGQPKAAVAPLRQGIACEPGQFDLQLALGEALLASGQPAEAERHLRTAARLDPTDPRPPQALQRLGKNKD